MKSTESVAGLALERLIQLASPSAAYVKSRAGRVAARPSSSLRDHLHGTEEATGALRRIVVLIRLTIAICGHARLAAASLEAGQAISDFRC